jgi:hypothetical protein
LQSKHDLGLPPSRAHPKSDAERRQRSRIDSAVVDYVITAELGHSHVAEESFQQLLSVLAPGYLPCSRRKVKRRLLEMYAVLKMRIQEHLPDELEHPARQMSSSREGRPTLHECTYLAETWVRSWKALLKARSYTLPRDYHKEFREIPRTTLQSMSEDDVVIQCAMMNYGTVIDLE